MRRSTGLGLLACLASCDYVVGLTERIDAATVDMSVFDTSQCSSDYNIMLPGSTSLYRRVALANADWRGMNTLCASAITHLAVIDTEGERDELRLKLPDDLDYFLGMFQEQGSTGLRDGWFTVTGEVFAPVLWGPGVQPNDQGQTTGTEDGEAQFAAIRMSEGLIDNFENGSDGAICECDGRAATLAPP